jgi:hypothetical protein
MPPKRTVTPRTLSRGSALSDMSFPVTTFPTLRKGPAAGRRA